MTELKKAESKKQEAVEMTVFGLLNKGLTDWYRQVHGPKNQLKKSPPSTSKEEKSSLFPYCS